MATITEIVLRIRAEDGDVIEYRMGGAHGSLDITAGMVEGAPDAQGYRTFMHDPRGNNWSLVASGTGLPRRDMIGAA